MSEPVVLIQGNVARPSGFSRVNRQLARGLAACGWNVRVLASDAHAATVPRAPLPDIYLFHGHPYDLTNAPGRVNVFYLAYDYARFVGADRDLAGRLNAHFDLLIVPSTFSRASARRSGVRLPIVVCPYGVDVREFHPPRSVRAGERPFTFLALGGATERKGTDLAVRAFVREFRQGEPVQLRIKAFSYDHLLPWMARVLASAGAGANVVFEHGNAPRVAPFYRGADVGVFPFRGEGFGLPILECLACGTPAIVTRGGGPLDYASGAHWIRASRGLRDGKDQLAPDLEQLQHLMRHAFERGVPTATERAAQSLAVSEWTWDRTVDILAGALRAALARHAPAACDSRSHTLGRRRRLAHVFAEVGATSWKHRNGRIRRCLNTFADVRPFSWRAQPFDGDADVVVGQSGFCLEALRASARRRPDALRIVYRESGPPESMLSIANQERARCGAPERGVPPIGLWRHHMECRLADLIVVWSRAAADRFADAGYPRAKLRIVQPGFDLRPPLPIARTRRPFRVLFVASDPYRKGARTLFDAWRRIRPRGAELICVTSRHLLASPVLVRALVEQPSITWQPFMGHRQFQRLYDDIDCVVQPSLEDGFPVAVTDGMARGLAPIVSDRSGTDDVVRSGENGFVVRAGHAADLAEALAALRDDPGLVTRMGAAARETAASRSWTDFTRDVAALVEEHV